MELKAGNYGPLWGAAIQMAEDPAGELTALELVVSLAHSHQESFVGQAPDRRIPPQGWAGKWVAGVTEDGPREFIIPGVLSDCAAEPISRVGISAGRNFIRMEKSGLDGHQRHRVHTPGAYNG